MINIKKFFLKEKSIKHEDNIKIGVRSLSASFPGTASLAQAWSEYETKIKFERIDQIFENLKHEIDHIKKLNLKFINTEEIPPLIERTIEKIKREVSEKKRKKFATLLANCMVLNKSISCDDKINAIETLDTLTEQDIKILALLPPSGSIFVDDLMKYNLFPDDNDLQRSSKFVVSLSKLESRGLISESTKKSSSYAGSGTGSYWINRWRQKHIELLPYGSIFIKMIASFEK